MPPTFQQQSMSIPHINYPSYTLLKTLFPRTNSVSLLQPTQTPTSPLLPLSYPKKRPPAPPPAPAWTHHGMGKTENRPTGTGPDFRSPKAMDGAQKPRTTGRAGAFRGSGAWVNRRHRTGMGVVIIQLMIHHPRNRIMHHHRNRIMTRALQVLQHQ